MPDWQIDSPRAAPVACFLFAHGAGAPMDSEFMLAISTGLAAKNIEVVRFEFPYMAARRVDGIRRPPDKLELLLRCYREQIDRFVSERSRVPLYIGGKSLGGRMASMLAQEYFALGNVAGLVCLGYPFHPRGKPDKLRTEHLYRLNCPSLIVQGSRDPLGNFGEVVSYKLPSAIQIHWLADGDHDFKPRRASGFTQQEHWQSAVEVIAQHLR